MWSPNGTLILVRWMSGFRSIVTRELAESREKELYRAVSSTRVSHLAISPDGRRLAFVWRDSEKGKAALSVIPTAGGEPRELQSVSLPEVILQPAWTPDSRHIVFARSTPGPERKFELWRIPADGGEPPTLGLSMEGLLPYGLSVHPDGRRIAFTAGTPVRWEIWVMENVLPALKDGN